MSGAEGKSAQGGIRGEITDLDMKYHVFKLAKFATAAGIGFLFAEGLLTLGVFLLYGKIGAPGNAYSSPMFLSLDVAALALGVALSFFLNERITVKVHPTQKKSTPFRLLKFEGVNALGNLTIIAVQFVLLTALSVSPEKGNVVGAIVSYPITYLISMRFVWKPASSGPADKSLKHHHDQPPKKCTTLPAPVMEAAFLASLYLISRVLHRRKH